MSFFFTLHILFFGRKSLNPAYTQNRAWSLVKGRVSLSHTNYSEYTNYLEFICKEDISSTFKLNFKKSKLNKIKHGVPPSHWLPFDGSVVIYGKLNRADIKHFHQTALT